MKLTDLNSILGTFELDPFARGLQIVAASEIATDSFPRLDTDRPALVFHVSSANLGQVVRTLRQNYPASHPLVIGYKRRVRRWTLGTLSGDTKIAHGTTLYLPPLAHPGSPLTLANIMARLRAPVGGCPWDLEQTHESITRALVEETYEVIEAIAEGDSAQLKEELGDLLLHVFFQTQIARDENEFSLNEVGAELAAKLIRRHPHVFGAEQARDSGWVLENWEKIKAEEKRRKGKQSNGDRLDAGIPRHLPALTRAQKVAERVRRKKVNSPKGRSGAKNGKSGTVRVKGGLSGGRRSKREPSVRIARARDRERVVGELLLEIATSAEEYDIDAERALNAATRELARKSKG